MNNTLWTFYNNENQREAVKEFLITILKELAVERTFEGKETKGIKDARECVLKAFDRLEELYENKEKPLPTNSR